MQEEEPSTITADMSCTCGGTLETKDDALTDDSVVSCKKCGTAFGTYADVKAHALKLMIAEGRRIAAPGIKAIEKEIANVNRRMARKIR